MGYERAQSLRHGRGDLRDQVARRPRQNGVAFVGNPLRAENRGFRLIRGQHQGRHFEVAVEDIADPQLATDRRPLPDQIGDVSETDRCETSNSNDDASG